MNTNIKNILQILSTLKNGIRVTRDQNDELHSNFNDLIVAFKDSNFNVVELNRMKRAFAKISEFDVYHPSFYVASSDLKKQINLVDIEEVIQKMEGKTLITGGVSGDGYKNALKEILNNQMHFKIRAKIKKHLKEKINNSLLFLELKGEKLGLSQQDIEQSKTQKLNEIKAIFKEHKKDMYSHIQQYCIFNDETDGTQKITKVIDAQSAALNIILDCSLFTHLHKMITNEKADAEKFNISYNQDDFYYIQRLAA